MTKNQCLKIVVGGTIKVNLVFIFVGGGNNLVKKKRLPNFKGAADQIGEDLTISKLLSCFISILYLDPLLL